MTRIKFSLLLFSITLFSFFNPVAMAGQVINRDSIDQQVSVLNDKAQYKEAIDLINNTIEKKNPDNESLADLFIIKSFVYKRLFDYSEVTKALATALDYAKKSAKPGVINNVLAEQAFAYFDIHQYKRSDSIMTLLENIQFRELDARDIAMIKMQQGYIQFLAKNYTESEQYYMQAIKGLKAIDQKTLPIVYGKMIELYGEQKQFDKMQDAFTNALFYANKYDMLKYKMYAYQMLEKAYKTAKMYYETFQARVVFDSLENKYNTIENKNTVKLADKEFEIKEQNQELKNEQLYKRFFIALSAVALLLIYIVFRLYVTTKKNKELVEQENLLIYDELEFLSKKINKKDQVAFDLQKAGLSEKQIQILLLIKEGKRYKEIADALFISENTIKYHMKQIFEALKVEKRKELLDLL